MEQQNSNYGVSVVPLLTKLGFLHLKMAQLEPADFLCKHSDWPSRLHRRSLLSKVEGGGVH